MGRIKEVIQDSSVSDASIDLTSDEKKVLGTMLFKVEQDPEFKKFAKQRGVDLDTLMKKLK